MFDYFQKTKGFTLIELIITLTIAAVLVSLAAPSFRDVIKNNRLSAQYNELLTSMSLTRSEAVKRGTDIIILSKNGANWQSGWTVFNDTNNNNTPDTSEIIRVGSPASTGITIKANNSISRITYHASGLASNAGTFTLCDDRTSPEKYAKALIINAVGRVRSAIDSDSDGIVNGGNAANVSCS